MPQPKPRATAAASRSLSFFCGQAAAETGNPGTVTVQGQETNPEPPGSIGRGPHVISIQSQVVHGHVGNSAAVFPMQTLGVTVAAVPTTLLSNHPLYPTVRGRVLDAAAR